jgi:hypothetical protein
MFPLRPMKVALTLLLSAALSPAAEPPKNDQKEIEIKGRVLDPDGKPVAGAKVAMRLEQRDEFDSQPLHVDCAADGSFRIPLRREAEIGSKNHELLAHAPGFGPAYCRQASKTAENKLTLVRDDKAIDGRVVDLEGRPAANVTVRVSEIFADAAENLDAVIEVSRDPSKSLKPYDELKRIPLARFAVDNCAVSDKAGRFRLTGIGRERIARVRFDGPTVATDATYVMTRSSQRLLVKGGIPNVVEKGELIHGCKFSYPLNRSSPIEGVVRDRSTGKPLPRINLIGEGTKSDLEIHARSGPDGKYRITGLPFENRWIKAREDGYPLEQKYFDDDRDIPVGRIGETTIHDLQLRGGVVVHVKVTNKKTGQLIDAQVQYRALQSNSNAKEDIAYPFISYGREMTPGKPGNYRVLVLPGPGVISTHVGGEFLMGQGAEELKRKFPQDGSALLYADTLLDYNAIAGVDPAPGSKPQSVNLLLDPGYEVQGRCVGPDGKSLGGVKIGGWYQFNRRPGELRGDASDESDRFRISGFDQKTTRQFRFLHAEKKLAAVVKLKGNEGTDTLVRLEQCATIKVQIRDDEGNRIPNETIHLVYCRRAASLSSFDADDSFPAASDGHFALDRIAPGVEVTAIAETCPPNGGIVRSATLFKNLTLKPGEVRDLGTVKLKFADE